MPLTGFHYLAFVFPKITDEERPVAVADRAERNGNVYTGTLDPPYDGLEFSFKWRKIKGDTNLATQNSTATKIGWQFFFFGRKIDEGQHRLNSTAGAALFVEISKVEAKLAIGKAQTLGGNKQQKAKLFRTDINAAQTGGTITPNAGTTLQQLYNQLGI